MRLLPCGDSALLLDCDDADEARRWHAALRDRFSATLGATTVLLRGRPAEVRALVAGIDVAHADPPRGRVVEVPVRYDGPDLAAVADHTGLSRAEVVAAHTGSTWQVGFAGFAPGFAYLVDGDPRLGVPRLPRPRARVPAGSVGLAGAFSGIYPRESPGGWQLIGHTDLVLWDLSRDDPATLRPGDLVKFVEVER